MKRKMSWSPAHSLVESYVDQSIGVIGHGMQICFQRMELSSLIGGQSISIENSFIILYKSNESS